MQLFIDIVSILLALATLAQCLVWWWGFGQFNRKSAADTQTTLPLPDLQALTVIVCARNEAENLEQHLPLIFAQQYPAGFTVLVVNDASDDNTKTILSDFSAQYSNLKVLTIVQKAQEGKKAALAAGVEAAETEWIVVTDADCAPASSEWLLLMAQKLGQGADMVLGYGPLQTQKTQLNAWAQYEVFLTALQYFSFLYWKQPYMGVGRNMAWRKSLFKKTGGFEKHIHITSGDDDLFVNEAAPKARVVAQLLPNSFVYSAAKETWHGYYRQKNRHLSTGKFYRPIHKFLLGFAALSHSCHYLFMLLLLLAKVSTVFVLFFYVIRIVSVILVCLPALRTLKEERLMYYLPFFDFLLPVFYVVFTPSIFLHKNNRPRSWT